MGNRLRNLKGVMNLEHYNDSVQWRYQRFVAHQLQCVNFCIRDRCELPLVSIVGEESSIVFENVQSISIAAMAADTG